MSKLGHYATMNITGTINILKELEENNIKYFIFSSSAAVYGLPQYSPIDEEHVLNPINFYTLHKFIELFRKKHGKQDYSFFS